jgi:hypothetical protein
VDASGRRHQIRAGILQPRDLGAYLIVWHPVHNSLPRRPEFQQVDVVGQSRFSFNTFNPKWHSSQWKQYLQSLATLYGHEPALAGYMFDDSFGIGPVNTISGPEGTPASGPYPLTDPFPQKYLYDRLELHERLREYLHAVRRAKR